MKIAIVIAAVLVGACGGPQYVPTVEPYCRATTTVWIRKKDNFTEETSTEIEGNNLAREKLCGRSRPPATPKTSGAPTS